MEVSENIKKKNRLAYIIVAVCLLLAGSLLYYIISDITGFGFDDFGGQGSTLNFAYETNTGAGFENRKPFCTESGITSVLFAGKISVKGTAAISVVASDGTVVYHESYTDVKSKKVKFEASGLEPYTNYTLVFSSNDANSGSLKLFTKAKLVVHPEVDSPTKRDKPSK